MKNTMKILLAVCMSAFMLMAVSCACAQAYSSSAAQDWLNQFASAISAMAPINNPEQTADPARAGQYLIEYEFGTVTAGAAQITDAAQILEIDVRTQQVTDCRGVRVGMNLNAALDGRTVGQSGTQLYVLGIQQMQNAFSWAYLGNNGIYGVEYIAYGGQECEKEYTLTYVIEDGRISAIRLRIADSTFAQAQDALATAAEIAARQHGEVLAQANQMRPFGAEDLIVLGGAALGGEVADLIACIGEPLEIQTLQNGGGRMLVYDGALIHLNLDEYSGAEIVCGMSVSGAEYAGPRGLSVGFSLQEAAALFYCEKEVSSLGGILYLAGEALGEPPYGELIAGGAGDITLAYTCLTAEGEVAVLEAVAQDGIIAYWTLQLDSGTEGI